MYIFGFYREDIVNVGCLVSFWMNVYKVFDEMSQRIKTQEF